MSDDTPIQTGIETKNVGILSLLVPRPEALAKPIVVRRATCRAHVYMQILHE